MLLDSRTARQYKENFDSICCIPRRVTEPWQQGLPMTHEWLVAGSCNFMSLLELLNISESSALHWKANVHSLER